jgi:D-3-phosphoglycerate dehydrogenase / 2-oxoglutarate reductase
MSAKHDDSVRILLLENIHASARDMLAAEGLRVETAAGALKEDELRKKLEGVSILGIRSKTQVRESVLREANDLLAVGAFCIGTNQVDLESANACGVPVFNAPFSNTRSVAELIIAEVIALARQLGDRSKELHAGTWKKVSQGCYEVRGKTLGIIGYGHIGSQVGVLAEAMGMRVVSYDIRTTMAIGNARPVDTLDEVLAEADFLTLHVPETPQTKHLMGRAQIAKMKSGSYLLNASRGMVVDIEALADALKSKHLAGAAIDVYPEEPETNSDGFQTALRGLSNVILTPHVGGSTEEAQAAIGKEVAVSILRYLRQGTTAGSVNFPQAELPPTARAHRLVNVHRNVPGVLRDINRIVSDRNANIRAQLLSTDASVGYLIMDLDHDVVDEVSSAIAGLKTSIKTRVLK